MIAPSIGIGIGIAIGSSNVAAMGGGFTPEDLFPASAEGSWFPQSDLTAYFTTNTGATNIAANDDTIGLALDKRLMGGLSAAAFIAASAELVTNGDFTSSTIGWTKSFGAVGTSTFTAVSGVANLSVDAGQVGVYAQSFATIVGRTYKVTGVLGGITGSFVNYLFRKSDEAVPTTNIVTLKSGAGTFSALFVATATTTYLTCQVNATSACVGLYDNISVKAIPGNHASQATTSFQPKYKTATTSRKYDGSDDWLVGTALCGASGNSVSAKITAPAIVSATQVISGLQASTLTRFFLAIDTSGHLCGGVGSDSVTTIVGTTDIRGLTGVATLIEDGSNVYLYWNDTLEYTGVRTGTPSTTPVYYEGALNNNGTAASFFSGEIYDRITAQRALTAGERAQLLSYWS